jgi:HEPN domain-containing protein
MTSKDAQYRLKVAQGFLEESREDMGLKRWRSAVDNAQLAAENAAKAVLALVVPLGKTHNPAPPLRKAVRESLFPEEYGVLVEQLATFSETLGFDIHVQTDYGDEMEGLTPWEIFGEEDAQQAITIADETVKLAMKIIRGLLEN